MTFHLQRHLTAKARSKRDLATMDRIMLVVSIIYPATGIPQLIDIFSTHSAASVSLATWLAFVVFGALFLVYGIAHKLWPVVITQALWLVVDGGVTIGIIMYS